MKSAKRPGKKQRGVAPTAEAAMLRAARRAREVARRFGTPIYVLRDGKIVALKP